MTERLRGAAKTVPFVLFMVIIAAVLLWVLNQLAMGDSEREQQHAEIVALQAGLEEANTRLAEKGEPTVDVPPVEGGGTPVPPTIILGEPGADGEDGEPGEPGEDGEPGRDGKDGTDGEPGIPGADGSPGADGVNGTDGIDGSNGADGPPGPAGPRGVGIADIVCHTTGDWIITLTDGTALTVKGPCRVTQSNPTPTPSASTTTKGR